MSVPPAPSGADSFAHRVPVSPVGSRRIEETLRRMMSVFGVLFALQAVPLLLQGLPYMRGPLPVLSAVAVFGTVWLAGLAGLLHQWTRGAFLTATVAFALAVLVWPLTVGGTWPPEQMPWLVGMAGVPCGYLVIGWRGPWPVAGALGIAALIGWLRSTPQAGGLAPLASALNAGWVLLLAVAVLLVVSAIRRAAGSVDSAQGTALHKYADAQIDEATETERTRTDALVHDAVLTTFLSAASAQTPEARAMAVEMAQNAIGVLSRATVASHSGPKVPVRDLLERVQRDAAGIGQRFEMRVRGAHAHFLPEPVADAVVSAAVQAMTNSVKHAGGPEVPRRLVIEGTSGGGVKVFVTDEGRGFDPAAIASERLGLRVSILERMHRAGGEVAIRTAPGAGAEFVLSWPSVARAAAQAAEVDAAVSV